MRWGEESLKGAESYVWLAVIVWGVALLVPHVLRIVENWPRRRSCPPPPLGPSGGSSDAGTRGANKG